VDILLRLDLRYRNQQHNTIVKIISGQLRNLGLLAARTQAGLSQSEFARATGLSVRTLQEWEQGRKVPSKAAQSLLKLVSRHPYLLADLA